MDVKNYEPTLASDQVIIPVFLMDFNISEEEAKKIKFWMPPFDSSRGCGLRKFKTELFKDCVYKGLSEINLEKFKVIVEGDKFYAIRSGDATMISNYYS